MSLNSAYGEDNAAATATGRCQTKQLHAVRGSSASASSHVTSNNVVQHYKMKYYKVHQETKSKDEMLIHKMKVVFDDIKNNK